MIKICNESPSKSVCFISHQGISASLQSSSWDACAAYRQVSAVITALTNVRENVFAVHHGWYTSVVEFAKKLKVDPSVPRRCSRQTLRDNVPSETFEEYYRRVVTIPMLDYLIGQMKTRFSSLQQIAVKSLHLCPTVYLEDKTAARPAILAFAEGYKDDMPDSYISGNSLNAELDSWEVS